MNEHEKAELYADLHEHRKQLLGEIAEAQAEVNRMDGEMHDLFCSMGMVGKDLVMAKIANTSSWLCMAKSKKPWVWHGKGEK